jgi:pimeloyl-ACP methyl ester carboxylesterase
MGLRRFWAAVAAELVDGGNQVVVYDQRGHGESTLGDGVPAIADLGHDLRAVLDAVDAHDVVLVGHSMGGMSIQSYAAEHPDDFGARVRGVVLVATAARTLGRAVPAALVELLMGDRAAWRWRGAVGRRMVRGAIGQQPQRTHIDLTLEGVTATAAAVRTGFLLAMAEMDLREAGRTLAAVPTRILVGARDTLTPPRAARALADAISGAELEVIPGAGHMLPLEAPDRIVDAIRSVAAAREPAASSI